MTAMHSLGPSDALCISNLTIIGSDNGLSPGRRQAIIWTNAGILLIGPLGTNLSEIYIFSFKKMHLKMLSGKCQPFSPGGDELINRLSSKKGEEVGTLILCYWWFRLLNYYPHIILLPQIHILSSLHINISQSHPPTASPTPPTVWYPMIGWERGHWDPIYLVTTCQCHVSQHHRSGCLWTVQVMDSDMHINALWNTEYIYIYTYTDTHIYTYIFILHMHLHTCMDTFFSKWSNWSFPHAQSKIWISWQVSNAKYWRGLFYLTQINWC